MKRRRHLMALFALAGSGAAPAKHEPTQNDIDDARRVMRTYVDCIVHDSRRGNQHTRLVNFLSKRNDSKAAGEIATPDCLASTGGTFSYVSQLRFQPSLLRGQAFRSLYIERLAHPERVALEANEIANGWVAAGDEPAAVARDFSDCVVKLDRVQADVAIRADVSSSAETAAYKALAPSFARCVTPDLTVRFSRSVMEGLLSEALYRQATGLTPAAIPMEAK